MSLDGITTQLLAEELDSALSNSRIDKIFQPDKYTIVLHLRSNAGVKKLLISFSPSCARVGLCSSARENPLVPPSFCMLLRKYMSGARITSITNSGCERIVEINVSTTDELYDSQNYRLIIELMGRYSNCILVNGSDKILDSAIHVDFDISRVREVMPARIYSYPPKQEKLTPQEAMKLCDDNRLPIKDDEIMRPSDKALLNSILGLSPLIASQLCIKADIDTRTAIKNLSDFDRENLIKVTSSFLKSFIKREYSPFIYSSSDDTPIEYSAFELVGFPKEKRFSTISECIEEFYSVKDSNIVLENSKQRLIQIVFNALSHANKKDEIHKADYANGQKASKFKLYGDLILCNAHQIQPKSTSITCIDYISDSQDGPIEISIPLDPALSASDNAQEYYRKFRKAKRKLELSEIYLEEDRQTIEYLRSLKAAIVGASSKEDIDAVEEEIVSVSGLSSIKDKRSTESKVKVNPNTSVGMAKSGKASSRALRVAAQRAKELQRITNKKNEEHNKTSNYREFTSSDGYTILCGRNNIQNDALTFKVSNKKDWWFHVKGAPGTHVLLKSNPNDSMPSDVAILEAAQIAAFFSKSIIIEERLSKDGTKPGIIRAEIDYCPVSHVKKIPKAKPGMVIYEGYYSIVVEAKLPQSS